MSLDVNESLDLTLCRACGGRCCQASPGIWVDPERFFTLYCAGEQLTLAELREHLPHLGMVLWEKSGVPIPAPRSLASGCAFLASDGCSLSIAKRPCQCLALIPVRQTLDQPEGCLCRLPDEFSRDQARQAWQKYWLKV